MNIEEKYPHAFVFKEAPCELNFKVGQIVIIPKEGKVYRLENLKSDLNEWVELKNDSRFTESVIHRIEIQ